jgi:hypothetical protein
VNDNGTVQFSDPDVQMSADLIRISQLVTQRRTLKAQIDLLSASSDKLSKEIEPLVKAIGGKWQDDKGYARIIERAESVSFDATNVNQLAETWAKSEDPVLKMCGQLLLSSRKVSSGYSYLQIK